MAVKTTAIRLETRGHADIVDITSQLTQVLGEAGIRQGLLTVFCPSSTSAITTIEYEPGCLSDLRHLFDEITPVDRVYDHDARWGDGNGYSHLRAALLKASLTVPFIDGNMTLGTWQQVIYIDFDNRPRHRELVVQVFGE